MMLIINKASEEEPEWDDPIHLIEMACTRVTMLIRVGPMTETKYSILQVFTINNYITTNKSSQLLLLVIFLMKRSASSSARLSTSTGTTSARAWAWARARARARATRTWARARGRARARARTRRATRTRARTILPTTATMRYHYY